MRVGEHRSTGEVPSPSLCQRQVKVYVWARPPGGKKRLIPMDQASDRPAFIYTNYIKATPEQVWQGLTDPVLTNRYWRHATAGGKSFPSDWKKGSTYDLIH